MRPSSRRPALRSLAVAVGVAALLLIGLTATASAYVRPAGGTWRFENLFDDTKDGALKLTGNGLSVKKLVLVPGEDSVGACGSSWVRLAGRAKIRSYRSVNGRYAFGRLRSNLFVPAPVTFTQGGKRVRGKLLLLFGQTGRLVDSGQAELPGDCHIRFYARKGRS